MFNFGDLEATGKQVVAFVQTASAQITAISTELAAVRADLAVITAHCARLEASHETIMGYIAESDNDATASLAIETAAAAAAVSESAAQVTQAAAVVAEAAETAAPVEGVESAEGTETPLGEVTDEPVAAPVEPPAAAAAPTMRRRNFLDRI